MIPAVLLLTELKVSVPLGWLCVLARLKQLSKIRYYIGACLQVISGHVNQRVATYEGLDNIVGLHGLKAGNVCR